MNHKNNNSQIFKIAGRNPNNYCKQKDLIWADLVEIPTSSKYERINTSPRETIEFRLFSSTTNYTDFLARLEFVQAVVDYCSSGEHQCSIKNIHNWDNFKTYVQDKKYFYPTLNRTSLS